MCPVRHWGLGTRDWGLVAQVSRASRAGVELLATRVISETAKAKAGAPR